jgi:hypothetical protein
MADTHCLADQNLIIAAKCLSNAQLGTRHPDIDMTDCFLRMPGRGRKWPATLPHTNNLFAHFEWLADSRSRPRRHRRRQWGSHRQQHERTGERGIEGVGMGWLSGGPSSELSTWGLIGCGTLRPIAALHKSRQLPGLVLTGSPSRRDSQAIFRVLIGSHLSGAE